MAQAEARKLAAIMFTDMVGFSRQMGADETRTLRLLEVHNQVIQQAVAEHHGQVIKTAGDGFLVEFPSVVNAVQCAQHIQAQFQTHNVEKEKNEQIHVRIGIHLGDIVVQPNGDVLGDGVNIASRLQILAEPDTICISHVVYREVEKKLSLDTVVSLGRPKLKNIAEREPVYALLPEKPRGLRQTLRVQRIKFKQWRRTLQVAVALVLVAVGALLTRTFYFPPPLVLPLPDKPSIAVLPFVNLSGDPEQEYFSDGLTDDLTTDLSKISGLFIIAHNSAFTYKGKAVKVEDIGRELGVRYVLEGSVRKVNDRVRITAQLADATTGHHLWAERYDRPLQEIFALQDEIRQQIVAALRVEVQEAELERIRRAPTENLNAYDSFLRGLEYFLRTTKESNAQARRMFEKAIELDPRYAEAYSALALTYYVEWVLQWSPDPQTLERALETAQRAIALNDSLPWAHRVLSYAYLLKKQHAQASAEAERAVTLDPNDADGYWILADTLTFIGRPQEAIGLIEKAMRLNPRYPAIYLSSLGVAYRSMGRYEEAIDALKKTIIRTPNLLTAHTQLAATYSELGREAEARAEVAEVLRLNPHFSIEGLRQRVPYRDPAEVERYVDALRKAGLK
ncbi:MAG: adenylate/guanylate cyclase domain-containing protein [Deltaproteobacteria bacterium]|nr:adenylate/guanylate cyclase domain-containing protein [Deltaproteobacteria bacterium]